jgi:kynurenine formamidase
MNRCRALLILVSLAALRVGPAGAAERPARLVDLTYPFDEQTIYWPTAAPFRLETVFKGKTEGGFYYEANKFSAAEHGGTHLDAPSHFAAGRSSVDQIPLERLMGPAAVVDISARVKDDADAVLLPADLLAWEARHGRLAPGVILLVRTGWGRLWPDRKRYLGTERPGDVKGLRFPGISPQAAEWLVKNRSVAAVGIDTASVDAGRSADFRTHGVLAQANIPGLENVANLDQLPPTGASVSALPMKIRGASGAPCRIIAQLPPR